MNKITIVPAVTTVSRYGREFAAASLTLTAKNGESREIIAPFPSSAEAAQNIIGVLGAILEAGVYGEENVTEYVLSDFEELYDTAFDHAQVSVTRTSLGAPVISIIDKSPGGIPSLSKFTGFFDTDELELTVSDMYDSNAGSFDLFQRAIKGEQQPA